MLCLLELLLGLLLSCHMAYTAVHTLLEAQILLRACVHQWFGRVGDRNGPVLCLASCGRSLQVGGVVSLIEILLLLKRK
jgi:hypothetical protein